MDKKTLTEALGNTESSLYTALTSFPVEEAAYTNPNYSIYYELTTLFDRVHSLKEKLNQ